MFIIKIYLFDFRHLINKRRVVKRLGESVKRLSIPKNLYPKTQVNRKALDFNSTQLYPQLMYQRHLAAYGMIVAQVLAML